MHDQLEELAEEVARTILISRRISVDEHGKKKGECICHPIKSTLDDVVEVSQTAPIKHQLVGPNPGEPGYDPFHGCYGDGLGVYGSIQTSLVAELAITTQMVADLLNEVIQHGGDDAIRRLVETRYKVSDKITDLPDVVVTDDSRLGMLGILNGLLNKTNQRPVEIVYSDGGSFSFRPQAPPA